MASHAASYVYDANGRLRVVTSSTGDSSIYNYDALGNILSIKSVPSGQLAIFSFTPNHGAVGSSVTISGQGFSTTSSTVTFNGTAATVSSASTTQLVVAVPTGATTGPIAVTVGSTTFTTLDSFSVTSDTGLPPTVTSFSPPIASPGDTIAVSGSHFLTSAGSTAAGVGNYQSTVVPTNDTSLNFVAAPGIGSGNVVVSTPYGSGQSSQPLIVVPSSVGAANVVSVANLAMNGAAQTINISTGGKYGAATFQASAGQWTSLQVSSFSTVPTNQYVGYVVYAPSGAPVVTNTLISPSDSILSQHLPQLPETGTYLVVFSTASGETMQLNIAVENNPFVTSSGITVSSSDPHQTKRVVFEVTAGIRMGLNITNLTMTPSNTPLYVRLGAPTSWHDCCSWNGQSYLLYAAQTVNVPDVPVTALFTATLDPINSGGTGVTATVSPVYNPNGTVTSGGSSLAQTTTAPNENGYFTFQATAGDNLSLGIGNVTTSPYTPYVFYEVDAPNGVVVAGTYCYVPGCHAAMPNLPQTGTYYVTVYPNLQPVTMSYQATLSPILTGTLTPGTAFNVNLARPGQVAWYTFSGTAGDYLSLYMNNVSTVPSGGHVSIVEVTHSGIHLGTGYTTLSTTSSDTLNLPQLPVSDTYTVKVEADNADTATAQLTLAQDPFDTLTVNGGVIAQSTTVPSEYGYYIFTATAGQNITVNVGSVTVNPSTASMYVTVYEPNGQQPSTTIASGSSGQIVMTNVPAGTFYIQMSTSAPATLSYSAEVTSP